ncbi:MAG: DUF3108 domain-containing protein [Proteobacteria bacterium]|nr:DUF3108 domain-containing protein [Pseudomonadota bacterium]
MISKLIVLFCLILNANQTSFADYIPPQDVEVKTITYSPEKTEFEEGIYEYSVEWQGIPVGSSKVIVKKDKANITTVTATAVSSGVVKVFYSLRHLSESIFRSDTFKPLSFFSIQKENSKIKSREIKFSDEGQIEAKLYKHKNEQRKTDEEINFHSENVTLDPITAAFLARSLPVHGNEEYTFDVFNGKHRFLITLKVVGRENIKVEGKTFDTYKVVPTVKKLTDTEGEKRLRSAAIWVTADDNRDIVKLESSVLIGAVSAELVKFIPVHSDSYLSTARASLSQKTDILSQ